MARAFIFDMDGVLINSEEAWDRYQPDFLDKLFGKEISKKVGDTVGISNSVIYEKAVNAGFKKSFSEVEKFWDDTAFSVYDKARITPNIDKLIRFLIENNFKIGLVSASKMNRVERVLPRLPYKEYFTNILSLDEGFNSRLHSKPSPDGYLKMMKMMKVIPKETIILEDSNAGIKAAVDSGAYAISLSENLISGYNQIDLGQAKAKNMPEVIEVVKKWLAGVLN